jgi:plastocyanin
MRAFLAAARRAPPLAVLAVGVIALAACGGGGGGNEGGATQTTAAAPTTVNLRAGLNDPKDPNIAVLEFLPESITVAPKAKVQWRFTGPEPHSVTFFPGGQTPPAPGSDTSLFQPKPPKGPYDGTTLVNSGLQPTGPTPAAPFEVAFNTPGTYRYYCVIHPLMTGTVTVSEQASDATSQSEITSQGDQQLSRWLAEGRTAKQQLAETPAKRTRNNDGTTTWRVEMGRTTEHTDVLAFAPTAPQIKAGDHVAFVNNSGAPHTASFAGKQSMPSDPESPAAMKPAPGPSPQPLNASSFSNTGLLPPNAPPGAAPPERARSFVFTVPRAGNYGYVCILHAPSGMAGTIRST